MASQGHSSTQAPQSMQSSLTTAFPSFISMASTGHALTHDSQPVQVSSFTLAGIFASFFVWPLTAAINNDSNWVATQLTTNKCEIRNPLIGRPPAIFPTPVGRNTRRQQSKKVVKIPQVLEKSMKLCLFFLRFPQIRVCHGPSSVLEFPSSFVCGM